MRYKWLLSILLILLLTNSWAQSDSSEYEDESLSWLKPSDNEKSRLGVIMGLQLSTLVGSALPDNQPRFGLLGGGYGRINFKKTWSLQQELYITVRGSNFQAGSGDISAIKLLYLDAPLILFKQLKKASPHKIGLGISYAHLINAALFIDNKSFPTGNQPALDKNDWMPMLAYQYQLEFFAIQGALKYGLRNINLGEPWPDNAKPLNNNGTINNLTFELSFIF